MTAFDDGIKGRYLTVGGHRLYMDTAGEEKGRPVVLIHTAGQQAMQWRFVLPYFAGKGYYLVAPDLPGHGKSLVKDFQPLNTIHDFAEVVWETIKAMGLEKPIVVGCSIGGDIVLDLAAHHSAGLSGVVACEGALRTPTLAPELIRQGLEDSGIPSYSDLGCYAGLSLCGTNADPERVKEITFTRRVGDPRIYYNDLTAWINHDIRERAGDITCPVLVVWGNEDYLMPYEFIEETVQMVPGARLVELPGIGHYPCIESTSFNQTVEEFFATL